MAYVWMSPGVQTREVDYSDYVAAASSSVIGCVGGSRKGPIEPTLCTSQDDFIRRFGEPLPTDFGAYGAYHALSQASQLWYKRAFHKAVASTAGDVANDRYIYRAIKSGSDMNGYVIDQVVDGANITVKVNKPAGVRLTRDYYNTGGTQATVTEYSDRLLFGGSIDYYNSNELPEPIEGSPAGNYIAMKVTAPTLQYANFSKLVYYFNGIRRTFSSLPDDDKTHHCIVFYMRVTAPAQLYTVDIRWDGVTSNKYYFGTTADAVFKQPEDQQSPTGPAPEVPADYETIETFENLKEISNDENYLVAVINRESAYINVSENTSFAAENEQLTLSGGVDGASYGTAGGSDTFFSITTQTYDSTLNGAIIKFSEIDQFGYFTMYLMAADGQSTIEFINELTLDEADDHYIDNRVAARSNNIIVTYNPDYEPESTETISTIQYTISGGNDGTENLDMYDIIGTSTSEGLQAFDNPESYDINLIITPGWFNPEVVNEGIKIAQNRGDSLFIADLPDNLSPQQAADWTNGEGAYAGKHAAFNSSYGAFYYPWLKYADPFTKKDIWVPPSGFVAAQMAYTDRVSQPWFSPAGLNRGNILGVNAVRHSASKGERDLLYGNRNIINAIVKYKNSGIVIWGQKTAQRKPTALDRVNVRRLMNYLEKVISASTAYYVFEPNDEHSWDKWIDMVDSPLESTMKLRGVYDYKIAMRPTDDEIDNNVMPGRIFIKPTKSAEFIPVDFIIAPTGASFDELTAA